MKNALTLVVVAVLSLAGCGGPLTPEEQGTAEQSLDTGGGGFGNSCRVLPLHCSGDLDGRRGIHPGCAVTCGANETPFCLPGECFPYRAPVCVCDDNYLPTID
jgi:hypothetical protein